MAQRKRELAAMEAFEKRREDMQIKVKKVEDEMRVQYAKVNSLDLVIVMDCTISMDPCIEQAKTSILSIITNVKKHHAHATVRVGFVAYRDFCDGDKRLEVQYLTEDIALVRQFIGKLKAIGGGDPPEDIPGGLDAALKMEFTAGAKRLILVADAPCHGPEFHNVSAGGKPLDDPRYRDEIAASPSIRSQMTTLACRRVDVTFIQIRPLSTAKMVGLLEQALRDGERKPLVGHQQLAHCAYLCERGIGRVQPPPLWTVRGAAFCASGDRRSRHHGRIRGQPKKSERVAGTCPIRSKEIRFSAYWYDMKGLKAPTTCKSCKELAAIRAYKSRGPGTEL